MNDLFLFLGGCFVSVLVVSAVGLLLWGAANESREPVRERAASRRTPRRAPRRNAPSAVYAQQADRLGPRWQRSI